MSIVKAVSDEGYNGSEVVRIDFENVPIITKLIEVPHETVGN